MSLFLLLPMAVFAASGDLKPVAQLAAPSSNWYVEKAVWAPASNLLYVVDDYDNLHYWDLDSPDSLREAVVVHLPPGATGMEIEGSTLFVSGQDDKLRFPALAAIDLTSETIVSEVTAAEVQCKFEKLQDLKMVNGILYAVNEKNNQICGFRMEAGQLVELSWSGKEMAPAHQEGTQFVKGDSAALLLAIPNFGLASFLISDASGELELVASLKNEDFPARSEPMFGKITSALVHGSDVWILDERHLAHFTLDESHVLSFVADSPASGKELAISSDGQSLYLLYSGGLDTYDLHSGEVHLRMSDSDIKGDYLLYENDRAVVLGNGPGAKRLVLDREPYTKAPTAAPTSQPTSAPTAAPTSQPTTSPTPGPTGSPSPAPTSPPSEAPTPAPTQEPTAFPTPAPTKYMETLSPTAVPSLAPTPEPTASPLPAPTLEPTPDPTAPETPERNTSATEMFDREMADTKQTRRSRADPESESSDNSGLLGLPALFWIAVGTMLSIAVLALCICKLKRTHGPAVYGIAKTDSKELGVAINTPPHQSIAMPAISTQTPANGRWDVRPVF